MIARAETAQQRFLIYRRLAFRNRCIALLRLLVPALGLIALLYFGIKLLLASIGGQFGMGQIHFDNGNVVVDTPSYSGVMTNGDVFKISAQAADTSATRLDSINLKNGVLVMTRPNGSTMTAKAAAGVFNTTTQVVTIPGTATAEDSSGNSGILEGVTIDMPNQTMDATGHTHITTPNGMVIDAAGVHYDAKTSTWNFGKSTVTMAETDDSPPEPQQ